MWMASQTKEEISPYLRNLKSDLDVVQSFWVLHLMVLQIVTDSIYKGDSFDTHEILSEIVMIFVLGLKESLLR